jgi:hypothetical protein
MLKFTVVFGIFPICMIVGSAMASNSAWAISPTLQPTSITSLRDFSPALPQDAFLLDFQAVNPFNEDRDIAHFSIQGLSLVAHASMTIPLEEFDPGPPLGVFDVYDFYGDGVVSTDEWNAGTLLQHFDTVDGDYPVLTVDVTSALNAGIQQNKPYLSFNFRAGSGSDRYFLGAAAGVPGGLPNASISITPVPEPSTLTLLALGAIGLAAARRR